MRVPMIALTTILSLPPVLASAESAPDLVNLPIVEALEKAQSEGFELLIQRVDSSGQRDSVLMQIPAYGSEIGSQNLVYVRVSDGLVVPNVVGRIVDIARDELKAQGFAMEVTRVQKVGVSPNVVASQLPEAGTRIDASSEIIFAEVSSDIGIAVPSLVGLNVSAARETLSTLGLTHKMEPSLKLGGSGHPCSGITFYSARVLSANPASGSYVRAGTTITLNVERYVARTFPAEACSENGEIK